MNVKLCFVVVLLGAIIYEISAVDLDAACDDSNVCTTTHAECVDDSNTKKCKCSIGFKVDGTKCVAKGLTDSCTDNTECSNVANAECISNVCDCPAKYAPNKGVCNQVVTSVTCTTATDCTSIKNAECSNASTPICVCKTGSIENAGACTIGLSDSCTDEADCSDIGNAACTDSKCACEATYTPKDGACVQAVSQTTCSAGGKQCDSISNAECDTTSTVLKCTCKSGFTENINQCQETVSGKACTDKGNECNSITNAECDKTTTKCKCKDGYKETANTCTQVYGTACTDTNPCPGLSNSICTKTKCLCASSFVAVDNVCVKALTEITCTTGGDECPTNAVCSASKKCECGPDFALQGNHCSAKSGATSTKFIVWVAFSSSLMIMGNKLLM